MKTLRRPPPSPLGPVAAGSGPALASMGGEDGQDGQMVTPPGAGNAWVWGMQNATMLQYFSTSVQLFRCGSEGRIRTAR
ncbi:hypothetical protein BKA56DRAFT_578836 [Ilyonectria sp. MPI-CAGE-AT-0026]|nr:hypothetical protein BKA56DRAFT_578836 [Ilyonectria sp. MPI-CAGE-AT-0026]